MILKLLLGAWISAVIIAAFLWVPPAEGFISPEAARIVLFHVPCAVNAAIGFIAGMVYAIRYLKRERVQDDLKSALSMELGLLFAALATITGSIFAYMQWGSWWNWDPRETSMAILLVVYAAYFAFRSSISSSSRRARLSASYAALTIVPMVFLMFIMPRVMFSLHPTDTLSSGSGLSAQYRMVLFPAMIGFVGIYIWVFRLKTAISELRLARRSEP